MKMPRNQDEDVEHRTQDWLVRNNITFLDSKQASSSFRGSVDFIGIKPFAFAVEVFGNLSGHAVRMRTKRLLASRIEVALAFSRDLPLIGVVPDESELTSIPFVDRVFRVSDLPSIEILAQVRPSALVSQVLSFDGSTEPTLSCEEDLREQWQGLVSVQEMTERKDWPDNTLAQKISNLCVELDKEQNSQVVPRSDVRMSAERRLLSSRQLVSIFDEFIESHVPAKRGTIKVKLDDTPSPIRFDTWETSVGKQFIVRRLTTGDEFFTHKSMELMADAWILQSLFGFKSEQLIVVILPVESWFRKTIGGKRFQTLKLANVNALESSGWTVLPADFGFEIPKFVSHMRKVSTHE